MNEVLCVEDEEFWRVYCQQVQTTPRQLALDAILEAVNGIRDIDAEIAKAIEIMIVRLR